jgi:hypothetical protein
MVLPPKYKIQPALGGYTITTQSVKSSLFLKKSITTNILENVFKSKLLPHHTTLKRQKIIPQTS